MSYLGSLNLFFGDMTLRSIHVGHLRQYQEARVSGAPPFHRKRRPNKGEEIKACPASPKKANQEISILKMILRRASCWDAETEEFYERLSEEISDMPRALTPQQRQRWLEIARFKERWHLVYWYSVVAFETSMSTNEIRSLRVGDVNLQHRILNIPSDGAKNRYRARTIPLHSAEVLWAAEQLIERARDLGSVHSQNFLFPFRKVPAPFDPTRPMTVSGLKKLWQEVRDASGMTWFRPYDTRHTAITHWAEAGVAPEIIRSMAGHVSPRMMLHYTHISEAAKRAALEASLPRFGPQSVPAPFYAARKTR